MIVHKFHRIKNREHSKALSLTGRSEVKVGSDEGKGRLADRADVLDSPLKVISCHGRQIRTVRPSEN